MEKMYGLDLFSGIGGLSLALGEWVDTVAYCERDTYATGVLLSRMSSGDLDWAPIWDDVTTLTGQMLPRVDIIYGGFPCQDISVAGNGIGLDGKRSGLFFEIVRLAQEIKPTFIFLENVPAIRTRGLDRVIQELTQVGCDCRWTMLSAADVGANHKRQRWFLLAHTKSEPAGRLPVGTTEKESVSGQCGSHVADTDSRRLERSTSSARKEDDDALLQSRTKSSHWWEVEPNVGRVVDGLPNRVDRLKCLGNAVVPLQAKTAFKELMGAKLWLRHTERTI
jgi:DNA (cytosine-5)-methyltransferase 1